MDDPVKWKMSVHRKLCKGGFVRINRLWTPIENIEYYYKEIEETRECMPHSFSILTHFTIEEILKRCRRMQMKVTKKEVMYKYALDELFEHY